MPQSAAQKNMKLLALILPVFTVVIVSGCIGGSVVSTGNGIVIEDFKPTLSEIYSEQEINLLLRIENQGEARAEDIEAKIFGISTDEWDVFDEEKDLDDLLGVDPVNNVPGGTRQAQWTQLEAPELMTGQSHTYTPKVRVSYDYSTSAQKPITIVDKTEMTRLIQEGQSIPTGVTEYTAGPIAVDIKTGDFALSDTDSDYSFNLYIRLTNLWWGSNGRVESEDSSFGDSSDQYPLEMMITLPDELDFASWADECSSSWEDITMWDGQTTEITCELEVDDAPDIMTEGLIRVDLRYRFSVDASTTIKVTGINS